MHWNAYTEMHIYSLFTLIQQSKTHKIQLCDSRETLDPNNILYNADIAQINTFYCAQQVLIPKTQNRSFVGVFQNDSYDFSKQDSGVFPDLPHL